MSISFKIRCVPPKSTAQNRTMFRAGNGRTYFAKGKNAKAAETDFLSLLRPHAPHNSMEGPLDLYIAIYWPWRKSEPKKNRVRGYKWHDKRPDLDNWAKTFIDCMTRLNFFSDDSQVARLSMVKYWADEPGIAVNLRRMEEGEL